MKSIIVFAFELLSVASKTTTLPPAANIDYIQHADVSPGFSFLHMTDLHISRFRDYSLKNLKTFCDDAFPKLISRNDISFLAITGDFTDGIDSFLSLSEFGQVEEDWRAFRSAMQGCLKHKSVPVLTIRGNHDVFNVSSFHDRSNSFFRRYQTELRGSHFNHLSIHKSTGSYAFVDKRSKGRFVFIEASRIIPAPHQYHGEFSKEQEEWLYSWLAKDDTPTFTYVFTHFPLGSLTPDSRARMLTAIGNSCSPVVYLSGHIHSLIGKRGVQALRSHEDFDELQLSDFKWSGIVRKVHIDSSIFVDIDTLRIDEVSATILTDPIDRHTSVISVYSPRPIEEVRDCTSGEKLRRFQESIGDIHLFSFTSTPKCIIVQTNKGTATNVVPVDTRLGDHSIGRYVFSYFYEFLQLVVLVEYVLLVVFAREIFTISKDIFLTLYLVLSPLVPTILSEGLVNRKWVVSNTIAMFDIETAEVFLDSETTRVGITLLMYLLCAVGTYWKLKTPQTKSILNVAWTIVLLFLSLVDLRMVLARGGPRTLLLSPHTWFMVFFWIRWTGLGRVPDKKKRE
jgi:hypothetical protein